jgi:VCBS repeat-containing protein
VKLSNIIPFRIDIFFALLLFLAPGYLHAENCPDNAISYWKLDETSPRTYEDSIGIHTAACAASCPTDQVDGAVNGTQSFDGNANGINVPVSADFDWSSSTSFSVEMWVKRTSATVNANGEVLIGRIDTETSLEWRVEIRDVAGQGHRAAFKLVDTAGTGAGDTLVAVGSKPITTNKWHHIVAIRDAENNTNILYVDGQLDAQQQNLQYAAGFDSATANVNIGWIDGPTARPLNGFLDEVAVYNRVLTEQEIRSHYYLSRGYCAEFDTPIGIMPMGNSITKDRRGIIGVKDLRPDNMRVGYRKSLYNNLRSNNYWVDFTGSEADKNDGDSSEFDIAHAGWGGIRTTHLIDILDNGIFTSPDEGVGEINLGTNGPYLDAHPTDIILLHIGTNDVGGQINTPEVDFPAQPIARINAILDMVDASDPRTTVLLARIINRAGGNESNTTTFNDAIDDLAAERILAGDKIIAVDMEFGAQLNYVIDDTEPYTSGDLHDTLHPNPVGYPKMANLWDQVLTTFLPAFVAPDITSKPVEAANRDQLYSYQVVSDGTGPLTYEIVGTPPQGMDITAQGLIEWTPAATGSFDVTVRVTNALPLAGIGSELLGEGADEQQFTIEVSENQLPVGVNDSYNVAKGKTLDQTAGQGVLANDSDADGDTLTAVLVQSPTRGILTLNDDGSFTYVHDGSEETTDTFTYAASDGKGQSSDVTVTLNIEDGAVTPVEPDSGGDSSSSSGCFISAANHPGSPEPSRKLMMLGALAALGILVITFPVVIQLRRNRIIGN